MDRRQNEKKIYFLSVLSTVNTVSLMQYICKEKTISAFSFHFKQLQYLQAVQNNKHSDTRTHTRSQTHRSTYLWFILNAGRGNEYFQSPWSEKGNPFSFLPPTFLESFSYSSFHFLMQSSLPDLYNVKVIIFYNLFLVKL